MMKSNQSLYSILSICELGEQSRDECDEERHGDGEGEADGEGGRGEAEEKHNEEVDRLQLIPKK